MKTPINRPDNLNDSSETPWYESRYSSPVADDEWYLDPTIPENYIPVPGEENLFMIVDTTGAITGYQKRTMQEDGTWAWSDATPDIPDNYELVKDNLYKVTNAEGGVSYYLYIRNEDDTYCFVQSDENGTPYYDGTDADIIASNYIHEDDNIYSVYNDNGVKEGYAERKKNKDGKYVWKESKKPKKKKTTENTQVAENTTEDNKKVIAGNTPNTETPTTANNDGTYTVTEKSSNTVTEDGYTIIYETIVYNTYDANGKLLYTKQEGPYEVSRKKASASETPNATNIKESLDEEFARVSAQVTYDTTKATEILTKLNAERANQGLTTLKMDTNSESYKLACIRAADMAIYNYSSSESPLYGTLEKMVARWKCTTANSSENVWRTSNKTADEIHSRFQAYDGSRNVRMSASYTEVGIAVVEQDGQLYIAEIYLK